PEPPAHRVRRTPEPEPVRRAGVGPHARERGARMAFGRRHRCPRESHLRRGQRPDGRLAGSDSHPCWSRADDAARHQLLLGHVPHLRQPVRRAADEPARRYDTRPRALPQPGRPRLLRRLPSLRGFSSRIYGHETQDGNALGNARPTRRVTPRARALAALLVLGLAIGMFVVGTEVGEGADNRAAAPPSAAARRAAPAPARPDTVVTVSRHATGRPIAPSFLGVSIEYPALSAYTGGNPAAVNPVF